MNGRTVLDPEHPVVEGERIVIDGQDTQAATPLWIALNKPRGLVTTVSDEAGRDTVYRCLDGAPLPWLAPVGRLDKASEGLLLLCNDPAAAAVLTDPSSGIAKTYHVQVAPLPTEAMLAALRAGVVDRGERLAADRVHVLRAGERGAWLEVVLTGGRNRHIRRMLAVVGLQTRRLLRTAIGPLVLGELAKGAWRRLDQAEVAALLGARSGARPAAQAALSRPARPGDGPRA